MRELFTTHFLLVFIMLAYQVLLKLELPLLCFIYLIKYNQRLVGVPKAEIAKAGSVKPDQINICVGNKKEF